MRTPETESRPCLPPQPGRQTPDPRHDAHRSNPPSRPLLHPLGRSTLLGASAERLAQTALVRAVADSGASPDPAAPPPTHRPHLRLVPAARALAPTRRRVINLWPGSLHPGPSITWLSSGEQPPNSTRGTSAPGNKRFRYESCTLLAATAGAGPLAVGSPNAASPVAHKQSHSCPKPSCGSATPLPNGPARS